MNGEIQKELIQKSQETIKVAADNPITTFYVKNMCCSRCITVVKQEMQQLGVHVVKAEIGEMKISLNRASIRQIQEALIKHDLHIVQDKETVIISRIKQLLHEQVWNTVQNIPKKMSPFLSETLGCSYSHLSRLFTKHENITIEKYLILLKIEKVKELLEYDEQSLSDISKVLAYSSTQHLSRQFKLTTGISISDYKKFLQVRRISADKF